MPDKTRYDVIIAGGGFVGTTLALALAALAPNGFRVALIDAEPPQKDKRRCPRLGAVGGEQRPPLRPRHLA